MKKNHFLTAIALALAASASTVHAHDDAYLDTQKAPHGGQLRMAGLYHLELVLDKSSPVIADKSVLVYVTDHAGQKISTANATGSATILAAKARRDAGESLVLPRDAENGKGGVSGC